MVRTQPTRSALAEPWFDGCNAGRLLIQQCSACAHRQFYPRSVCTVCDALDLAWVEASGSGTLASFTVVRRPISPAYTAPYVVALVDLMEGPRLMTQIVDCPVEALVIGAAVTARFEDWGEGQFLPVFTLVNPVSPVAEPQGAANRKEAPPR